MVINISLTFSNLSTEQGKIYAIMVSDTVVIKNFENEVLTGAISCKYEDISYALEVSQNIKLFSLSFRNPQLLRTVKRRKTPASLNGSPSL